MPGDEPLAGARLVDGQLVVADPVEVAHDRDVAGSAEVVLDEPTRRLLHEPLARARPVEDQVGLAVAVEVALERDIEGARAEGVRAAGRGDAPGDVRVEHARADAIEDRQVGIAGAGVVALDRDDRRGSLMVPMAWPVSIEALVAAERLMVKFLTAPSAGSALTVTATVCWNWFAAKHRGRASGDVVAGCRGRAIGRGVVHDHRLVVGVRQSDREDHVARAARRCVRLAPG